MSSYPTRTASVSSLFNNNSNGNTRKIPQHNIVDLCVHTMNIPALAQMLLDDNNNAMLYNLICSRETLGSTQKSKTPGLFSPFTKSNCELICFLFTYIYSISPWSLPIEYHKKDKSTAMINNDNSNITRNNSAPHKKNPIVAEQQQINSWLRVVKIMNHNVYLNCKTILNAFIDLVYKNNIVTLNILKLFHNLTVINTKSIDKYNRYFLLWYLFGFYFGNNKQTTPVTVKITKQQHDIFATSSSSTNNGVQLINLLNDDLIFESPVLVSLSQLTTTNPALCRNGMVDAEDDDVDDGNNNNNNLVDGDDSDDDSQEYSQSRQDNNDTGKYQMMMQQHQSFYLLSPITLYNSIKYHNTTVLKEMLSEYIEIFKTLPFCGEFLPLQLKLKKTILQDFVYTQEEEQEKEQNQQTSKNDIQLPIQNSIADVALDSFLLVDSPLNANKNIVDNNKTQHNNDSNNNVDEDQYANPIPFSTPALVQNKFKLSITSSSGGGDDDNNNNNELQQTSNQYKNNNNTNNINSYSSPSITRKIANINNNVKVIEYQLYQELDNVNIVRLAIDHQNAHFFDILRELIKKYQIVVPNVLNQSNYFNHNNSNDNTNTNTTQSTLQIPLTCNDMLDYITKHYFIIYFEDNQREEEEKKNKMMNSNNNNQQAQNNNNNILIEADDDSDYFGDSDDDMVITSPRFTLNKQQSITSFRQPTMQQQQQHISSNSSLPTSHARSSPFLSPFAGRSGSFMKTPSITSNDLSLKSTSSTTITTPMANNNNNNAIIVPTQQQQQQHDQTQPTSSSSSPSTTMDANNSNTANGINNSNMMVIIPQLYNNKHTPQYYKFYTFFEHNTTKQLQNLLERLQHEYVIVAEHYLIISNNNHTNNNTNNTRDTQKDNIIVLLYKIAFLQSLLYSRECTEGGNYQ